MKYLISGGGTGGHIYPAIAIANEIKRNDKEADILYIGTKEGLESKLVPKEGINFETIRVKGMPRRLNKESFVALKELFLGLIDSNKIIKGFKPDIVIGTGGYVCGPIVYQAKRHKVPALIHEQNAFPGVTNKILSRYVDKVAVTFEESTKYFKYPDRVVVTGNPIRRELLQIDKTTAYKKVNVKPDLPMVLSFGGSGGQKKLNDAILKIIKDNNIIKDFQLIHITGDRLYKEFLNELEGLNIQLSHNIKILPYLYEMPYALNIADLVIASAGAITLAEISAIGIPSILVPKGYTAENHQEYNARSFEEDGASLMILESELNGKILENAISNILFNKDKLKTMAENSKSIGKLDASKEIYRIIENISLK